MRFLVVLAASVLIAGCQGALRKYDGVLGYTSTSSSNGKILISYTDEAHRSWADLEEKAATVCAHELNRTRESTKLSDLRRDELTKLVTMNFMVPSTGAFMGSKGDGGVGGISALSMVAPPSGRNESGERELKLKRLTADCFGDETRN